MKKHPFTARVDAEVFAAEQRTHGHLTWVTPAKRGGFLVTVRTVGYFVNSDALAEQPNEPNEPRYLDTKG